VAFPTIAINSGSGSDTAASGAGPSTALSGSLAATHTNTTVNITDAVNLSGVAVDGSAVLWVNSSSGRQFSAITAISGSSGAWVVTVGTAYANTESGKSWGIGGKRATLTGSVRLPSDVLGGWTVDIQTGETITASLLWTPTTVAGSPFILTSTTGSTSSRTKITTATASVNLCQVQGSNAQVSNLWFDSTSGTPGRGITCSAGGNLINVTITNCKVSGCSYGVDGSNSSLNQIQKCTIQGCEFLSCTNQGVIFSGGASSDMVISQCIIKGCTKEGLYLDTNLIMSVDGCIIDSCNSGSAGKGGVYFKSTNSNKNCKFSHNDFTNNTGPGLVLESTTAENGSVQVTDNIFYGNSTYGVDAGATPVIDALINHHNAYGSNTTAARRGIGAGTGDVTLTVSPFNSSSDWGLNATAGGGAACKGAGSSVPNASANTAPDIGAIPSGGGSAGGGGVIHRAGRGGGLAA